MMSAMLSDEPVQPTFLEPVVTPMGIVETAPEEKVVTDMKAPVHAMQSQWSTQKRLKKVQVQTLGLQKNKVPHCKSSIHFVSFTYLNPAPSLLHCCMLV